MRLLPLPPLFSLACLSLLWLAGAEHLSAAEEVEPKRVHFNTFDEVELSGSFYRSMPAPGKRDKDSVVLLLHDFRHAKGGGSKEDGWSQLAGQLQKEGYSVLSFDFRGFGNSRSVGPNFWKFGHNQVGVRGVNKKSPPASIDQKTFASTYYLSLVNDIAAARAFLDSMNDAGEVNSSNIILIGAGQGATLGALWLASECRRQRDPTSDRVADNRLPDWSNPLKSFDDPEGNDIAAAVWLSISPSLEGRLIGGPLRAALVDAAKTAKIPMLFLYGKNDAKAADLATAHLNAILTENGKKLEQKGVKEKAIPGTDLAGSKLLGRGRRTGEYIIDYLASVMEDRGNRVRKTRESQKFAFCWSMPWPTARIVERVLAKLPGEPVPKIIHPRIMGLR